MTTDYKIHDFYKGKFANVGLFMFPPLNKKVKVYMDFDVSLEYAERCVKHLIKLKDSTIDDFCKGAVAYCEDCREHFDDLAVQIPEGVSGREILKYIFPKALCVEAGPEDIPAFHLECYCDWEKEHGLELTVIGDEVLYVGQFADVGPHQKNARNFPGNYMVRKEKEGE